MFALLRKILTAMNDDLPDESILVIVLDRIELCDWKLSVLMNALVELVYSPTAPPTSTSKDELLCTHKPITIKIMVVLDPVRGYWDAEEIKREKERMDGNSSSCSSRNAILYQEWNQRALSPLEMQMQKQKRFHSY